MKVAVVIPTFNSARTTINLINILKKQTLAPDVIVIDGGSSENDYEKIKRACPDVQVFRYEEDLGGAGSYYYGTKIAYEQGYDYIILSDNDAIPLQEDIIETLIYYAQKNPKYGVVTVRSIYEPRISHKLSEVSTWVFHFFLIKREVVEKVGFPLKDFFIWCDDVEYSQRIRAAGYKIITINNRFKDHFIAPKPFLPTPRFYYFWRNILYVYKRYKIPLFKQLLKHMIYIWFLAFAMRNFQLIKLFSLAFDDFLRDRYGKRIIKNLIPYNAKDIKTLPKDSLFIGPPDLYNACKGKFKVAFHRLEISSYFWFIKNLWRFRKKAAIFAYKFIFAPVFDKAYLYAGERRVAILRTGILQLFLLPIAAIFAFIHTVLSLIRFRHKRQIRLLGDAT